MSLPASVQCMVAPLAGAWIEIEIADLSPIEAFGRSPRGSVD